MTPSSTFRPRRRRTVADALRLAAVPMTAVGVAGAGLPSASAATPVLGAAPTAAPLATARGATAPPTAAHLTAAGHLTPGRLTADALAAYVVVRGDTLSGIALRSGTDVATLVRLNRITVADRLQVGEVLVVPSAPTVRPPAPPKPPTTVSYTVKAGDTLWDIATRTRTTVAALLAANHLADDAVIVPGQVLLVPAKTLPRVPQRQPRPPVAPVAVHVVKAGETVTSIAARYRLTVAAVLTANRLDLDSVIRPGQKLKLPGVPARRPQRAPAPVTHAYVVQRGDTLSGIALAARVPLTTVTALNRLSASDLIFPGQRLLLPGPAPTVAPSGGRTAAARPAEAGLRTSVRRAADANRATLATRGGLGRTQAKALVQGTARRFGVEPALALAVAHQESGFDQRQVSSANAVGVMQVVPSSGRWASSLVGRRLDLFDTRDNVIAGVAILSALTALENEETAIAAYYQGLTSVRQHGLFPDTRRYVADVLALRQRFR